MAQPQLPAPAAISKPTSATVSASSSFGPAPSSPHNREISQPPRHPKVAALSGTYNTSSPNGTVAASKPQKESKPSDNIKTLDDLNKAIDYCKEHLLPAHPNMFKVPNNMFRDIIPNPSRRQQIYDTDRPSARQTPFEEFEYGYMQYQTYQYTLGEGAIGSTFPFDEAWYARINPWTENFNNVDIFKPRVAHSLPPGIAGPHGERSACSKDSRPQDEALLGTKGPIVAPSTLQSKDGSWSTYGQGNSSIQATGRVSQDSGGAIGETDGQGVPGKMGYGTRPRSDSEPFNILEHDFIDTSNDATPAGKEDGEITDADQIAKERRPSKADLVELERQRKEDEKRKDEEARKAIEAALPSRLGGAPIAAKPAAKPVAKRAVAAPKDVNQQPIIGTLRALGSTSARPSAESEKPKPSFVGRAAARPVLATGIFGARGGRSGTGTPVIRAVGATSSANGTPMKRTTSANSNGDKKESAMRPLLSPLPQHLASAPSSQGSNKETNNSSQASKKSVHTDPVKKDTSAKQNSSGKLDEARIRSVKLDAASSGDAKLGKAKMALPSLLSGSLPPNLAKLLTKENIVRSVEAEADTIIPDAPRIPQKAGKTIKKSTPAQKTIKSRVKRDVGLPDFDTDSEDDGEELRIFEETKSKSATPALPPPKKTVAKKEQPPANPNRRVTRSSATPAPTAETMDEIRGRAMDGGRCESATPALSPKRGVAIKGKATATAAKRPGKKGVAVKVSKMCVVKYDKESPTGQHIDDLMNGVSLAEVQRQKKAAAAAATKQSEMKGTNKKENDKLSASLSKAVNGTKRPLAKDTAQETPSSAKRVKTMAEKVEETKASTAKRQLDDSQGSASKRTKLSQDKRDMASSSMDVPSSTSNATASKPTSTKKASSAPNKPADSTRKTIEVPKSTPMKKSASADTRLTTMSQISPSKAVNGVKATEAGTPVATSTPQAESPSTTRQPSASKPPTLSNRDKERVTHLQTQAAKYQTLGRSIKHVRDAIKSSSQPGFKDMLLANAYGAECLIAYCASFTAIDEMNRLKGVPNKERGLHWGSLVPLSAEIRESLKRISTMPDAEDKKVAQLELIVSAVSVYAMRRFSSQYHDVLASKFAGLELGKKGLDYIADGAKNVVALDKTLVYLDERYVEAKKRWPLMVRGLKWIKETRNKEFEQVKTMWMESLGKWAREGEVEWEKKVDF